jgi:predicted nuclease with TOPRIM domain
MKACKDLCPVLKVQRCCFLCDRHNECDQVCNQDTNEGCELLIDLPEELTCEQEAEPILEKLEQVMVEKKELEEKEKELKEALKTLMESRNETGLKTNSHMKVTYISASSTTVFDTDLFKKTDPATYSKFCTKPKETKSYIKCELLKEGKKK